MSLSVSQPRVFEFADYQAEISDTADMIVVGSGPGGAVVAKELAELGHEVILLEEGPPFRPKDFTPDAGASMCRLYREAGMRAARGKSMFPTMQAIALGGGSVVNSAIAVRPPDWVFEKWSETSGISLDMPEFSKNFQRVEDFLGIEKTSEDALHERNLLFKGCDALGISSEPCPRNVKKCKASGECFSGCRAGAKQSTDVSYVPAPFVMVPGCTRVFGRKKSSSRTDELPRFWVMWSSPLRAKLDILFDSRRERRLFLLRAVWRLRKLCGVKALQGQAAMSDRIYSSILVAL